MTIAAEDRPAPERVKEAASPPSTSRALRRTSKSRPWLVPLFQLAIFALFLGIWQAGVESGFINAFLYGSPAGIWEKLVSGLSDETLFYDTGITMMEAIIGFAIGTVLGSAAGLSLWYSPFVARVASPFIAAINSIPKIALAPMIILWVGTGLESKVVLAVSLTAIVALITAFEAAKDADADLQALLVTLGGSKNQVFFKVVVPASLPAVISTFRINLGFALVGAVVGEFISSQRGLGHMIYTATSFYELNTVWVGLFILMFIGFILYRLVDLLEAVLLPWKQISAAQAIRL
jgi:NitT/TauT family transport system permease protein